MANILKIKRSTTTATPIALAEGELAYSEDSDNLFVGTAGGNLQKIGGNTDVLKLAGIEAGATADQTNAQIKTAYEANSNTNEFSDAEQTKLAGIATSANNYSHPSYNGDDFSIDTGALTGATVVSDIDINVTTDTSGHVTDANATIATRNLTAADIGALSAGHDASEVTFSKITNWDDAAAWHTAMTGADGDNIIDTVNELVAVFENHAEGLNLITELDNKLTSTSTIDGGTF